jgi:hypothetical protein
LTSRLRPQPRALLAWGAAALTAAALFYVPWLLVAVLGGAIHGWWFAVLVGGLGVFVLHVRLQPEHPSRAALWLVLTQGAALIGIFGAVVEIVATDSCGGSAAANAVRWSGATVIYLGASAWGLQRPLRGLWAVPLAAIVAGAWLAAAAHLVSGGAGACFN